MVLKGITGPLARYWGTIRSAAADRLTTAALWAKIAEFEQAQGVTRPPGVFRAVQQMRSLATSQRVAAERFAKLADEHPITAAVIAPDINARTDASFMLAPMYNVRFEANMVTETGLETRWLTLVMSGDQMPVTKGELMSYITIQSPGLAYGSDLILHSLTGRVEIAAW